MSYNPTASLKALQTDLGKSGYFAGGVQIGEPFSPPNDMTAALMFMDMEPSQTTLSSTIDVWTLLIRIYMRTGMTPENAETTELNLALAVSQLEGAMASGFTLGGTVRAIDWAGEEAGHKVSFKWGHVVIAQTIFRAVDVLVPLIVDDSATFG